MLVAQTTLLAFVVLRFAYQVAVLGVTAYAVFWLDRSGWWFALALVLVACSSGDAKVSCQSKPER